MKPLVGLLGITAVALILIALFYAYSAFAPADNRPVVSTQKEIPDGISQKALISDSLNQVINRGQVSDDNNKAERRLAASGTKDADSKLDGLNQSQLEEGLANVKAGLELLENPLP